MISNSSQLLISSKKPKSFKMKYPPVKPERKEITRFINITNLNLAEAISLLPKNISFNDIRFDNENNYRNTSIYITYTDSENTEEYGIRYKEYLNKLGKYNVWAEQNKSLIEQRALEEKAKKEKAKEVRKLITEQKKQERIAWLQKELEKELKGK